MGSIKGPDSSPNPKPEKMEKTIIDGKKLTGIIFCLEADGVKEHLTISDEQSIAVFGLMTENSIKFALSHKCVKKEVTKCNS